MHPPFLLAGPTASGKSSLAAAVAERIGAEIVGADAFQIYRGLDLLTAKPDPATLARIPHHLVGEIPLAEPFNVARYRDLAAARVAAIRARHAIPLAAGGTGLYLRSFIRPLADLPPADPALRAELETLPRESLLARLAALDPDALRWIDRQNPRRLVRALEVCLLTGRPFSATRSTPEPDPAAPPAGALLVRERGDLLARIRERTSAMFASGVVAEVAACGEIGPTASQTLGLRTIQALLRDEITPRQAADAIEVATRQYAKRQMTWFRSEPALFPIPIPPGEPPETLADSLAEAVLRHEARGG